MKGRSACAKRASLLQKSVALLPVTRQRRISGNPRTVAAESSGLHSASVISTLERTQSKYRDGSECILHISND
ncbi:hypothetical protein Q8A67_019287 [Cirrhinus molitorella]|uniref:Uncharacterized protein n=1 Tax=Cirrhinus molitorella TaxID=172907 RepID=A0AA88PC37_9TELE|nr:hypothetical protein Q8A67_019287 [Cirrhinus molitorella]